MSDSELNNPHDRFVKQWFGRIDIASSFFTRWLPPQVVGQLDFDTLEITRDSFVSEKLRFRYSDLLYQIKLKNGEEAQLYLLLEHKSQSDRLTVLQLLRYMVAIWDQQLAQKQQLSAVIPIVLYHGATPWNTARTMHELLRPAADFAGFTPSFEPLLVDLSSCSDEDLKGEAVLHGTQLLLKYVQRREINEQLGGIFKLFVKLAFESDGLRCIETLLRYITYAAPQLDRDKFVEQVKRSFQDTGEKLMPTIAEQWKQEGREEGIEKGREEGREEGLRSGIEIALKSRFPEEYRKLADRLAQINSAVKLERILNSSVNARTVAEIEAAMQEGD